MSIVPRVKQPLPTYEEVTEARYREAAILASLMALVKDEATNHPMPDHTEAKRLLYEQLHPTAPVPPSAGTVRLPARSAYRPNVDGLGRDHVFERITFIKELRELNPELTLKECKAICDTLYPDYLVNEVVDRKEAAHHDQRA